MYKFLLIIALACTLILSSNRPNIVYQKDNIEVYRVAESKELNKAHLTNLTITDSANEKFAKFGIKNYELKAASRNNLTGVCANSKDGQHIHWIVDNKPYTALYQPKYKLSSDSGSHLALAFLSRSHHQSIKTQQAYKLKQINIGNKSKDFNLKKPYLFYSRPKGVYVDNDAKDILLDFYLVNTFISSKGNRVKVELDNTHKFIIYHWQPHIIRGLAAGEHKIKMSLLDKNNREINCDFLPVERNFAIQYSPKID